MVTFEGMPYPLDMVYLKLAGEKEVFSIPFCEAMGILTNVSFNYKRSITKSTELGSPVFVIKGDTEKEKNVEYEVSKTDLMNRLQLDIYEGKSKITDIIIQPVDELLITEVKAFINL